MTQTEKAWESLFQRYNILKEIEKNGYFIIDAKTVKTVREPRLMTKFDHSNNLPNIFKKNDISILPISRSKYIIGQFEVYKKINHKQNIKPIQVSFPTNITTIDPFNLYSENAALHCAYVSGMIDDVLGEETIQTISGRMSSGKFNFLIHNKKGLDVNINVTNSQIEIDSGLESDNHFIIIEAKNETVEDFNIRQLYYPYRLWKEKTYKNIIPILLIYSNDIFRFFIFKFLNPIRYNSLELVERKDYVISHEQIEFEDIIDIFNKVKLQKEPQVPFPQADSFPRVIDLLGLLYHNDLDKQTITSNYDFTERQTDYYTNAGIYLGLIDKYRDQNTKKTMFCLTNKGRKILNMRFKQKYLSLASSILSHKPFYLVMKEYLQTSSPPTKERLIDIMKTCNVYNVNSEKTFKRRAQTLIKWVEWILDLPIM